MKFSAFGDVISQTSGTTPPLHSYTGQSWDADADLMYYRARWYDPTLGRFISEDPMGFEAGDANLSRYVGNGGSFATDPTGLDRGLTDKERQALEYIYRAALPGIRVHEEYQRSLAETLAEVRLIDWEETCNPLALVALTTGGARAFTQGEYQYYDDMPRPNEFNRLGIIGHETMHSLQEELCGDGTLVFNVVYLGDVVGTGLEQGDFYEKTMSETFAHAMENTIIKMMNDPVFNNAVVTGTTGQLPEDYRRKIAIEMNAQMTNHLRP